MRKSVISFKDSFGLFWHDRYKPLFEAAVNLVASIALYFVFGMIGIFIGTVVSTLSTCFWIEPYVLYRYGFKSPVRNYFGKYLLYSSLLVLVGLVTWWLNSLVSGVQIEAFLVKLLICAAVPNLVFLVAFFRTEEFHFLLSKILPHKLR